MTFKPGMHQIVQTDDPIDFNAIVQEMGKPSPKVTMPTCGMGKKIVTQIESRGEERIVVLEVFTELVFNPEPHDPSTGFTAEDITRFRGVNVLDVEPEPMDDGSGYHQSCGVIVPYDEFVAEHITDSGARLQLDRLMENMDEHIEVGDKILEQVNGAWENRPDKDYGLYKITYN